jgi:hypothetical protein
MAALRQQTGKGNAPRDDLTIFQRLLPCRQDHASKAIALLAPTGETDVSNTLAINQHELFQAHWRLSRLF